MHYDRAQLRKQMHALKVKAVDATEKGNAELADSFRKGAKRVARKLRLAAKSDPKTKKPKVHHEKPAEAPQEAT